MYVLTSDMPNRYIEVKFDVGTFSYKCPKGRRTTNIKNRMRSRCNYNLLRIILPSQDNFFFQFHSKWEAYLKFCIQTLFFFFFVFNPSSIRCCCCREKLWFIWLRVRLMFNESFLRLFVCWSICQLHFLEGTKKFRPNLMKFYLGLKSDQIRG